MKVSLISYTPDAEQLLLFTKNTRLEMTPDSFDAIRNMKQAEKEEQLKAMARTIPSSWEFVDFVFLFEGITRSTAQQITRTRSASYAMQSLRVVDASQIPVDNPFSDCNLNSTEETMELIFDSAARYSKDAYESLIRLGASREDARDILPLGTTCNLVAKYNLRTLVDLCRARESLRAQGPYREIAAAMQRQVLDRFPTFSCFFEHPLKKAIDILEGVAKEIGITTGSGPGWEIAKAIDLIKKG